MLLFYHDGNAQFDVGGNLYSWNNPGFNAGNNGDLLFMYGINEFIRR